MRRTSTITLIAAFSVAASAFAQENADAIKQRILAQAQSLSENDFAFTRTSRTDGVSNGKSEKGVLVEKFDPTKAGAARWTLVSIDGAPPAADALARYNKESAKRRVPGYFRLANYFGSPASASQDAQGRTVFRFASLPKETVVVMGSDISHNASAEVTVGDANGTPFAEQVRVTIKPMRLKLVMKLESFDSTNRYRMGPDGQPILIEAIQDLAGSGMGQEGKMHTASTYTDYRAVRR
jgi:hypothetical protein